MNYDKPYTQKIGILLIFMLVFFTVGNAQTIDVLTYNIRYDNPGDSINNWNNRKDFLISQLKFYEPDIFGTQEGLLHQLKDIEKGLEGYAFFGKGRDNGLEAGEFSAIFYKTTAYDLLLEDTFWLSETPETPSKGWDAAIKRVCTFGKFRSKKDNAVFWVFNTHFDHIGEQARKESILLILKKIKEINAEMLPAILMGDLNLEPRHESMLYLADKMEDTYTKAGENNFGPSGTYNGFKFDQPVVRRIDYIFTSEGDFSVMKNAILSDSRDCSYPSDHLPVYAKLRFN